MWGENFTCKPLLAETDAIVTDPRRLLRIVDIEGRRLILEVEHDAVDERGAADDAQRLICVSAPDALDGLGDGTVVAAVIRYAVQMNA